MIRVCQVNSCLENVFNVKCDKHQRFCNIQKKNKFYGARQIFPDVLNAEKLLD